MVLHILSELPDDAPTPFVRPGFLSWTVAPKVPVRPEPAGEAAGGAAGEVGRDVGE